MDSFIYTSLVGRWRASKLQVLDHLASRHYSNLIVKDIQMLSQAELKSLLNYNPDTGIFTWMVSRGTAKAGQLAGTVTSKGYIHIKIKRRLYLAHRLAWMYTYGTYPNEQIDHENMIRNDNRILNIRLATHANNQQNKCIRSNNTSGRKGVSWDKGHNKWHSRCTANGKCYSLGYFDSVEQASLAYQQFASEKHGEFFNNGEIL
jgi:hypothetical protein